MENTAKIEIRTEFTVKYDTENPLFREALDGYKTLIHNEGGIEDLLFHVVHNVNRHGCRKMVEGIGYVSLNGEYYGEPHSGIGINTDDPDFEFELVSFGDAG